MEQKCPQSRYGYGTRLILGAFYFFFMHKIELEVTVQAALHTLLCRGV